MILYDVNLNLALNFCAAVVLQPIITLVTNSLSIKVLLDCFLVHLLVDVYVLYGLKDTLL